MTTFFQSRSLRSDEPTKPPRSGGRGRPVERMALPNTPRSPRAGLSQLAALPKAQGALSEPKASVRQSGSRSAAAPAFGGTSAALRGSLPARENTNDNALIFFYEQVLKQKLGDIRSLRARRSETVRVAPSIQETRKLLGAVADLHGYPCRSITRILYGCGMRVSEPLNLRIKDVRLAESRLVIRGGKGRKDRVVALPCSLAAEIKSQIAFARAMWERDARNGVPVPLPGRLDRKYPRSRFAWKWYWLFPAHKPCKHPRTGEVVRWRCHEANIQRAVKIAAQKIGMDAIITPHCLRHAYATHTIEHGASVCDVQSALGHKQLDTTMRYVHADGLRVPSPLVEEVSAL